jgi:hypothetical protein
MLWLLLLLLGLLVRSLSGCYGGLVLLIAGGKGEGGPNGTEPEFIPIFYRGERLRQEEVLGSVEHPGAVGGAQVLEEHDASIFGEGEGGMMV